MGISVVQRLQQQGYEKLHASFRDGTFYDSVRKGNLTPNGGAAIQKTENGMGLYLPSAQSSWVNCGTTVYTPTDGVFTISVWVKQRSQTDNAQIVGQIAGGVTRGWMIWQDTAANIQFWVNDYAVDVVDAGVPLVVGRWTHLTGVSSATQDIIYINGVVANTSNKGAGAYVNTVTNGLWLGAYDSNDDGGPNFYFDGYMDEVIMYGGYALNAWEVATLMAETKPRD